MAITKAIKDILWHKCGGIIHGDIPELYRCPKCNKCLCDHKEQPNCLGWICADGYRLWIYPKGSKTCYIPGSRPK